MSCHLRDVGGYRSTVGYICYRGTEPLGNVTGGQVESMCRLTHVIMSVSIKDHIVGGPLVILNACPHLAGRITHSYHEAE